MEAISAVSLSSLHQQMPAGPSPAMQPPPQQLVDRFEHLMQASDVNTPHASYRAESSVPTSLVSKVQHHLDAHMQVMDNMMSIDPNTMSAPEVQQKQMEFMTQMSMLSMNQHGYTEILSSTKSAVSTLMKNQ